MKNTFKKFTFLLLAVVSMLTFTHCKALRDEGRQDVFVQAGKQMAKAWGVEKIKKFFPEANLEKDSVYLRGTFKRDFVRSILQEEPSDFFTPDGDLRISTQKFLISIDWTAIDKEATVLEIIFVNRKARTDKKAYLPTDMKNLYVAIADKLKTILDGNSQPKIKWIDRWNNQPTREQDNYSFASPSVFIDFGNVEWSRNKKGIQEGKVSMRLYVAQQNFSDTYEGSSAQAQGLSQTFDLLEDIYVALQDFSGATFSPLQRISTDFDSNYTNLQVDVLAFSTIYTDTSKADNTDLTTVRPGIDTIREHV